MILVGWRTGGANSEIYVVDGFPFPIKASTWTHVSQGIPPQEYKFELLKYQENLPNAPFENIVSTSQELAEQNCPDNNKLTTSIKEPTENFDYNIHVFYGPEFPVQNCPIKLQIKFLSKYSDTDFLNQIQYDILAINNDNEIIRSIAEEEGKRVLFSPSGQSSLEFTINEDPGTATYTILIYGESPEHIIPAVLPDYLTIEIPITENPSNDQKPSINDNNKEHSVPSWIKTSVGFWVDGSSSDTEFINSIQFLINEGIIIVS